MRKKNGYISRLFFILCFGLISVSIFMAIAIQSYSKSAIEEELVNLNETIIKQVADDIGSSVHDAFSLISNMSNDNQLIAYLSETSPIDENETREIDLYFDSMIVNNLWTKFDQYELFEAYITGENGVRYCNSAKNYEIEEIIDAEVLQQKLTAQQSERRTSVLLPTMYNDHEKGIYRYSYAIAAPVKDHITEEQYGHVILNISEATLFYTYKDLVSDTKEFVITDENGIVLSSNDKRQIGSSYFDSHQSLNYDKEMAYIASDNNDEPLYFYNKIKHTPWYLVGTVDAESFWQPFERIQAFIVKVDIIVILLILLLCVYFAKKTVEPVYELKDKMNEVAGGNLEVAVETTRSDEFGQMALSFNHMVGQINELIVTVRTGERKKRMAEIDFLRMQINPHFIYNTLSSIRFYVEMDKTEEAGHMLLYFSKLLRKTLSRADEYITLEEELETIRDYVQLQKLRYAESFEVEYEVPDAYLQCMLPTLVLQPIVENAIFYGAAKNQVNHIRISVAEQDSTLLISIKDSGIGMSREQVDKILQKKMTMNKVGIKNVHERLQLNYGEKYGLTVNSVEGLETEVILKLPVTYAGQ